jgi:hypothetical protein
MIKVMKFVGVPVSDQQRALDHTEKLGFLASRTSPSTTRSWIELGIGRNGAGIALFTPPELADRIGTFTGTSLRPTQARRAEGQGRGPRRSRRRPTGAPSRCQIRTATRSCSVGLDATPRADAGRQPDSPRQRTAPRATRPARA